MEYWITAALAFLAGSLPGAWLAGKLKRVDLKKAGSGNLGATNAMRVLGPIAGAAVLTFDAAKGFSAVLLLPQWLGSSEGDGLPVVAALACVLGHVYSPWFGFRGGKGVATGAAVSVALAPWSALVCLAAFLLTVGTTRYISVASLTAATLLPVSYALINQNASFSWWVMAFCLAASTLVVVSHRANIARLVRGEEPRWVPKSGG